MENVPLTPFLPHIVNLFSLLAELIIIMGHFWSETTLVLVLIFFNNIEISFLPNVSVV